MIVFCGEKGFTYFVSKRLACTKEAISLCHKNLQSLEEWNSQTQVISPRFYYFIVATNHFLTPSIFTCKSHALYAYYIVKDHTLAHNILPLTSGRWSCCVRISEYCASSFSSQRTPVAERGKTSSEKLILRSARKRQWHTRYATRSPQPPGQLHTHFITWHLYTNVLCSVLAYF